ncbi:MAG: hypothetical protein L6R42_004300 [Xanthoria sp. 1 TBL-2021]|nr:MAG: hypothetical protein L6R42_004300 [Xanthoria sp. 1 TBL-2021]
MVRPRRRVDLIASERQSPPGNETGFPWGPLDFYRVQSAAAGTDEKTVASPPTGLKYPPYRLGLEKYDNISMQQPELEAALLNLELDAWSAECQELEPQSYGLNTWTAPTQRPELDSQLYGRKNLTSSEHCPELESQSYGLNTGTASTQRPELDSQLYGPKNLTLSDHCPELESQSYGLNTWIVSTQRPELDSQLYALNNHTSLERRPEFGSFPINDRSELPRDHPWTERWTEKPTSTELYVNELELMGSLPSYTDTQHSTPPYNQSLNDNGFQPGSSSNPTVPPAFIAGYSIPNSPPHYDSLAQHYWPSTQPVESVPNPFSLARPYSTSAINGASIQQWAPSDQSAYQRSHSFSKSPQVNHSQERLMRRADHIEGQSSGKTPRWCNFTQTDPLADHSDDMTCGNPRCSAAALLRTMPTHNPILSVSYASKEPQPDLGSRYHFDG